MKIAGVPHVPDAMKPGERRAAVRVLHGFGSNPKAQTLLAATPADKMPEITTEKTGLKAALDELPKLIGKFSVIAEKFSGLEDQTKKVVTKVDALTDQVKDNPSLLLRAPK